MMISYSFTGIGGTKKYITSAGTVRVKLAFWGLVTHYDTTGVCDGSFDPIGNVTPGSEVTIYNDGTNTMAIGVETSGAIYVHRTAGSGTFAIDFTLGMI